MIRPVLITIRGNSASGKSTIAAGIRNAYGRGVAIVGQDLLRREVLREPPAAGGANIALIDLVARHALDHGFHTLVEGILEASVYGAMYLADFYNQAVIHNDTRGPDHNRVNAAVRPDRDHYFGRIWKINHKQAKKIAVPNLASADTHTRGNLDQREHLPRYTPRRHRVSNEPVDIGTDRRRDRGPQSGRVVGPGLEPPFSAPAAGRPAAVRLSNRRRSSSALSSASRPHTAWNSTHRPVRSVNSATNGAGTCRVTTRPACRRTSVCRGPCPGSPSRAHRHVGLPHRRHSSCNDAGVKSDSPARLSASR